MDAAAAAGGSYFSYMTSAAAIVGLAVGSLLAALYYFQDNLLYYPSMPPGARTNFDNPARLGLTHEEIFIRTSDGVRIQTWFFPYSPNAATMLYFHGNAGNISYRLVRVQEFRESLKCNILIVAYRGYGKSDGTPNEKGLRIDAQAALEYLQTRPGVDPKRIFLYGESLGGAVATHLASQNEDKIQAMILENTFTSIPDMIEVVFPILNRVKWLSRNEWNTASLISQIRMPVLFLSGQKDELVPPRMMRSLFNAATNSRKKEMVTFKEGRHNDTWLSDGYAEAIHRFLSGVNLA
jgi:fermentation-respiration switch protein FrsA (DUF1100 family)